MADPVDDPALRGAFRAAGVTHEPGLVNDLLQQMARFSPERASM
ncbi:hypothetical protein [Leifsonia kafniensis]